MLGIPSELLTPSKDSPSGQHMVNNEVSNADDDFFDPSKSFTIDNEEELNKIKKEALGLMDIPAGSPDGAQNHRPRDSYSEGDFEASFRSGFGGESVIDVLDDKHPINNQVINKEDSANINENKEESFFSLIGFKSSGYIMSNELKKLAYFLDKSGYSEYSSEIEKIAFFPAVGAAAYAAGTSAATGYLASLNTLIYGAAAGLGATTAVGTMAYADWENDNKDLLSRIGANGDDNVVQIFEKFKTYLKEWDFVWGFGEWPKGDDEGGERLAAKFQSKFNSSQKITESELEGWANSIRGEQIFSFDDEMFFVNSFNAIVDLKKMAEADDKLRLQNKKPSSNYTMYTDDELTQKRDEKLLEKRRKEWEDRSGTKIVKTWVDDASGKVLGTNDRGETVEWDDYDKKYVYVDGYPLANWKYDKDDKFRQWRASKRYQVIQYKDNLGKWITWSQTA